MLFFITHQAVQNNPWMKNWQESKKNITTFLIAATLYVFLASFLYSSRYQGLVDGHFVLFTLRNWFLWIVLIDITTICIIYKNYWGKSILEELPETWNLKRQEKKLDAKKKREQAAEMMGVSRFMNDDHKDSGEDSEQTAEKPTLEITEKDVNDRQEYLPKEGNMSTALGESYSETLTESSTEENEVGVTT